MKTPEVNERNFYAEAREIEKTLKLCPFCGNKDIEFSLIHPQYWGKPDMDYWCYWEILCPECGAHMENARLDTQTWDEAKEEIIELWNQRYPAETAGHDRKEWRFNNPKKTTAQLAAFLCMPRKVFEEAVRNGMKQEAAMEKEKRNETTDL